VTAALKQGYAPLYQPGCTCPGCGKSQWTVGRFSAECVYCATALPFGPARGVPATPHHPSWADRV